MTKGYLKISFWLLTGFFIACNWSIAAEKDRSENSDEVASSYRTNCALPKAFAVLNINNARSRIKSGGDLWGLSQSNRYSIPVFNKQEPRYDLFYGGGKWIGGLDEEGNMKMAIHMYLLENNNDWWPGPIEEQGEMLDSLTCKDWERFFEVRFEDLEIHRRNIQNYIEQGLEYPEDQIPNRIKYWPGAGNPFFSEKYGFELPNLIQGLAPFFDYSGNGIYNPADGDFPVIGTGSCEATQHSRIPDQMYYWIFNDAGGIKTRTNSDPVFFEVRGQAFAFKGENELADMTFYRYQILNRGPYTIDSLHMAKVKAPTIGCPNKSYVGSKPDQEMMYTYVNHNEESLDDCDCPPYAFGDRFSYCGNTPAAGVSYLNGFEDSNGEDLGLSSFIYFISGVPPELSFAKSSPNQNFSYFNYLTGSWLSGDPLVAGGTGYNPNGGTPVRHAFTDSPHDPSGWSMCSEEIIPFEVYSVMSTGPVTLQPGGSNEVTMAVTWVPDLDYPCPDLSRLFSSNKRARTLFDACFETEMRGPDAPKLVVDEADMRIDFTIENSWPESNNANEDYREKGTFLPDGIEDDEYVFEGYKVYQLRNQNVEPSPENLRNPQMARLVYQADVENGIGDIYNWEPTENPNPLGRRIFRPTLMVEGSDAGIEHNFTLENDAFSEGGIGELEVGQTYYYTAIAYAYNNYEQFNWREPEVGQRTQYIASSRNVKVYSVNISSSLDSDAPEVEEEVAGDIDESPSIFDKKDQLSLQIYGNPVRNHLRFEINGAGKTAVHLRLLSAHGQEVYSGQYSGGMHTISTSDLPSGLYFMEVFDPESKERVVENWIRQ